MRIGCGYLFSKEKILSGAPRGLLGGPKGRQDDGQHIFPKCQLYEQRFGFFWYGIIGIGGRYMFFNENIFPGLPRGLQGAPRVAKVKGSIFFQNIHCMSSILGCFFLYGMMRTGRR